jgi:protein-disulfide isomerase
MIKTSLLGLLLTTTAFAETKVDTKKMELLPLSTTDNKAAASEKPKVEEIKAEIKTDDPKKETTPEVKEPAKVESIAADGTVKLAEAKTTEAKSDDTKKDDDDKAFEAKAVEPGDTAHTGDAKVVETSAPSSFNTTQQADIEKLVLATIEKNPEILVKAIQGFSESQQKEALKKEAEKMTKFKDDLLDDKTAVVGGNPNGSVKLVVFGDPNCPHCRHFEANLNDVKGLYSNLKVYMRPWPIMGNESADTVTGLMAAAKQGYDKYESLVVRIATSNEKVDKVKFLKMAKELGIDMKKLQKAMDSEDVRKEIKSNHELAVKIGLDATPTIIMFDGTDTQILMPGDKESLKKTLTDAKA